MPQKGKAGDKIMKNTEKKMVDGESDDYEADFKQLTFNKGTRLHLVTLKFKQQVKVQQVSGTVTSQHLESDATDSFIVTTHENQWAAAEGALFEHALFSDKQAVSWPLLANAFQVRALICSFIGF